MMPVCEGFVRKLKRLFFKEIVHICRDWVAKLLNIAVNIPSFMPLNR